MARRVGKKLLVGLGMGTGGLIAAAAITTGSAASAQADFADLLDPVIQPFLTSFTDSLTAIDPASAAEPAAALAAATDPVTGTYDIPLHILAGTEPAVQVSVDGGSSAPMLVDTGSSGLVIPWEGLGTNDFAALEHLFQLGEPADYGFSGYSGGVEYFYLVYNDVPTVYGDGALSTSGPVDVELFSWSDNWAHPFDNFEGFVSGNHVDGILGLGQNTAGPTESPLEAAGFNGVLVNVPGGELTIAPHNPITGDGVVYNGAPISTFPLTETVTTSTGQVVGTGFIYNDLDSGGVYGTIPSSIANQVSPGDTVSVYGANNVPIYSYVIGAGNGYGVNEAPTSLARIGTSVMNSVDSGVVPFLTHEVYLDYGQGNTSISE